MRNIKFTLMYDGSAYSGWQRSKGGKNGKSSIQGLVEQILTQVLDEPITVIASGRTDAGVHALGQVANFHLSSKMDLLVLQERLNISLPEDIRILSMEEVPNNFHSRYNALRKTYVYRINVRERECVFSRRYTYPLNKGLCVDKMREAAKYLIGTHDFKAFCTDRKDGKSTVREISKIEILEIENDYKCEEVHIKITGNGFLHHMVRIITGTLLEVGTLKREPITVKEALDSLDRSKAGEKIDSRGLFLVSVMYT